TADTVLGTEDPNGGFVGGIPGANIIVASDGEASFDPFGRGIDTSDGIQFGTLGWTFTGQTGWVGDGVTWVLPADLTSIGCGVENEPTCEPLGQWFLAGGVFANPGVFTILSAEGTVSDTIILANVDGGALVSFTSDPGPVPLPAALPLFA